MAVSLSSESDVYVFKVKLGYDKRVWRRIEILGIQTLHDLSLEITDAFDLNGFHLYSFFMSGRAWDPSTEYVSPDYPRDSGQWEDEKRRSDDVRICSLGLRPKQRFLYLFDYGEEWRFEIEFLERVPPEDGVAYPRIIGRRGESPSQYLEDEDEAPNIR